MLINSHCIEPIKAAKYAAFKIVLKMIKKMWEIYEDMNRLQYLFQKE